MSEKRDRQPNFSLAEELLIVEECEKRKCDLFGNFFGASGSLKRRKAAWGEVAAAVNSKSVGGAHRTPQQVKKKYENIKAAAKQKASQMRRPPTGGGPPPKEPKLSEQILLDNIMVSPSLTGIQGGIDTEDQPAHPDQPAHSTPAFTLASNPITSSATSITSDIFIPIPSTSLSTAIPDMSALCTLEPVPSSPSVQPVIVFPSSPNTTHISSPILSIPQASSSPQPNQSPVLFPPPQAPRQKRPRSDKVLSDLHSEVLRLEAERIKREIDLADARKKQEKIMFEAKMDIYEMKKRYYSKLLNEC